VGKTTPTMEKKHEIVINKIGGLTIQTSENRFNAGEKLGFGKNIIRNTIPKTAINSLMSLGFFTT
jgi:hypothetical protein